MSKLRACLLCAMIAAAACRRSAESTGPLVRSLRCGMTRDEVTALARRQGYDSSDASWLQRSAAKKPASELTLVDLTFRRGRLVAYRQASYVPRTRRVQYRTIELCSGR